MKDNSNEIIRMDAAERAEDSISAGATGDENVSNANDSTQSSPNRINPTAVVHKSVQTKIFKIIVIGDSNVGKTCLSFRFCGGKFPQKTEATIGVDFRERTTEVEGERIKLQLWDTAGQERFRKSMVPHYYRNVHAVVFVYDVTRLSSFDNLPMWIYECDRYNLSQEIPRIIVGNKCDAEDLIQVSTNDAQKFADMHNMPLFETSAKDDALADHVESIFMTLAHKLKNAKPMMPATFGYVRGDMSRQISSEENNESLCGC